MKIQHYLVALILFAIDRAAKWLVVARLDPERPVDLIPGYLRFIYTENTGVAFGLFDSVEFPWKPHILAALAAAAVAIILIYSARAPANRVLLPYALAVALGGVVGNFFDRVLQGYVVDFIDFHIRGGFHWPAFNVADSGITIGVALLLIDALKNPAAQRQ